MEENELIPMHQTTQPGLATGQVGRFKKSPEEEPRTSIGLTVRDPEGPRLVELAELVHWPIPEVPPREP